MRSPALLGVLAGLLAVVIIAVAAMAVLPDLAPSAASGGSPTATARDSSASASPGATPSSPGPSADPTPGGSFAPGTSGSPASPAPSTPAGPGIGVAVGQEAPAIALNRLGGGKVDLTDLRGTPVWVNFVASWCPPCRDELPLMAGYQAELGDRLAIVLVDVREDADTAAALLKSLDLEFTVALDSEGRAQRAWSAYALPIHFWIDAEGIVRGFAYGGLGPPQMEEGIRKVLPDAFPTPAPSASVEPGASGDASAAESPVAESPAAEPSASPVP